MANSQLTKTNPTANTDSRKKGTIAFWVKRSKLGATQYIYTEYSNGSNAGVVYFSSADTINFISYDSGTTMTRLSTNQVFRDTNAWYHIVFAYDSTLATADDRQKLWVNGEQITSFASRTNPSQNGNFWFGVGGTNYPIRIGSEGSGTYFDGYFAHFHRVDSQALDETVFGSYDSTTGIWKPKTNPSITYTGTSNFNFFLDFADSSNLGNDISGENNDLSATGNMTQTIDTPSNVFATLNGAFNRGYGSLSNGNTTNTNSDASNWNSVPATLGASSGKWYCEAKLTDATHHMHGVGDMEYLVARGQNGLTNIGFANGGVGYYGGSGEKYVEATNTSYGNSYGDGDIIGIALDLDNNYVYFSKNGTWQNSGVPTSGASGTGGIALPHTNATYTFCFSVYTGGIANVNFGNGYFGTTAVASAGTNSGIGTFEYDVPSGYKALCTKNINAQEYS